MFKKTKRKVKKSRRRSKLPPGSLELTLRNSGQLQRPSVKTIDAEVLKVVREKMHAESLGMEAYVRLCNSISVGAFETAGAGGSNFLLDQVKGRDHLLDMAQTLALLAHGRAAWLTKQAVCQRDHRSLAVHLQGCERATATFMQLMRAIGENGQPKKSSTRISIAQANVGEKQLVQTIVQQSDVLKKVPSDEQTRIYDNGDVINGEVVSAVEGGAEVAEGGNQEKSTVEKEHGSKKPAGKRKGRAKRVEARRTVSRNRRFPPAG